MGQAEGSCPPGAANRATLRRIVQAAVELVDATYGALGVMAATTSPASSK